MDFPHLVYLTPIFNDLWFEVDLLDQVIRSGVFRRRSLAALKWKLKKSAQNKSRCRNDGPKHKIGHFDGPPGKNLEDTTPQELRAAILPRSQWDMCLIRKMC